MKQGLHFMRDVIGCLFFLFATIATKGQTLSERSLGFAAERGFIFAHSQDVQNTSGANPIGIQLSWNKQWLDEATWNICGCFPRTGWVLQYVDYDNSILGRSLHIAPYIEPYWGYGNKLSASIKAIAGLSYLTNPYHPEQNPANQSYSLPVSGYVALGFGLHYRVNPTIQLHAYGLYNHISNGGIKDPNKGINWPTFQLGMDYTLAPVAVPTYKRTTFDKKQADRYWEIGGYWSSRTVKAGEKNRWHIWGVQAKRGWQVASINDLTVGAELWYDYSLKERMRRQGEFDVSPLRAGVLGGHAFRMGRFDFSQQIGVYVYNPSGFFPAIYQRYGLLYRFSQQWYAGVNVLAHGHVANFLDFRLAHRLH